MNKILTYICCICVAILCCATLVGCNNAQPTPEPTPTVTYTVSYSANGGTGSMASDTNISGQYTLLANNFIAPTGKEFKCWLIGTEEKVSGTRITVTADTEVKAVWKDIPAVTPIMLKVTYTQGTLDVGDTVDKTTVSIKCVYSDGTSQNVNISDATFWIDDYEITDYIDNPIPFEGMFDVTVKYGGLEALFRVVCLADRDGEIVEFIDTVAGVDTIKINFNKMLTEEDLYSIFSPSIENVGVRMDDDGLCLAYDEYGLVRGASIESDGAWFRFRQPNFKYYTYDIELKVDTSNMVDGQVIRFHGDEAVAWTGDFAVITKSNVIQTVKYTFEANNDNYIVVKVYINGTLINTVTSTATVEDFLGGSHNQSEGICWAIYDFGEAPGIYTGGAVITEMSMHQIQK